MKLEFSKRFIWIPMFWGSLLLLQAWLMPIIEDESYYWMYSRQLDWGYFDHPPMVALLIKLSSCFLSGILGVRVLTIAVHFFTLMLIWKMIDNKNVPAERLSLAFCLAALGLPLFHIYGFITTPDVPLLFTTAWFFYTYQKICLQNRTRDFVILGAVMGLMMLSKYHGALVIIFVLLSNPKLLINPKTYLAGAIGLSIWSPHLYWQYQQDWISFRYHLIGRANNPQWYHPLEFVGNALLVFNPIFIGLLLSVFRNRWRHVFERGLYFTIFGFIAFFALASWRDHVQPQWLVVVYIPFLILLMNRYREKQFRYLKIAFWCSFPLFIGFHAMIAFNIQLNELTMFKHEEKIDKIADMAMGEPVVFANSYRATALYSWYRSDELSHSYNDAGHRKNQFSIWMNDSTLHGENVYVSGAKFLNLHWKEIDTIDGSVQPYYAYDKIKIRPVLETFNNGGIFNVKISNPYHFEQHFGANELCIFLVLFNEQRVVHILPTESEKSFDIPAFETETISVEFDIPADLQAEEFGFSIGKLPWPACAVFKTYPINSSPRRI